MITEKTSRTELLHAIHGEPDLVDAFIKANLDPEHMETGAVFAFVQAWVEAGNEAQ